MVKQTSQGSNWIFLSFYLAWLHKTVHGVDVYV